jgi:hypothetical protein
MATVFVLVIAALGLLALLGAVILVPYLCALAAGRVVGWAFQASTDVSDTTVDELLSPERIAKMDALVASSQRMLLESQRRAAMPIRTR